jgi:hypothetical protein
VIFAIPAAKPNFVKLWKFDEVFSEGALNKFAGAENPTMQTRALKLTDSLINVLVNLPESGMGYQLVKVILKSGDVLHQHKVLNSEVLMLEENENITVKDIEKIELEKRT